MTTTPRPSTCRTQSGDSLYHRFEVFQELRFFMITMRKIFYFYFFYFDYNTNIECSVTRILYSKKNMNVNVFCKQIRRQYAIIVKYSYIRQKDLKQSNQSTKILVYSLLLYSSSGILTAVCQSLLI